MNKRIYVSLVIAVFAAWRAITRPREPSPSSPPTGPDPAFELGLSILDEALSYETRVPDPRGIVLLVHGTGMTPKINWEHTLVPSLLARGYQPVYLAIPYRLMDDGQISAEYLSHAIKRLSQDHPSVKGVSIISWSAGGLIVQWTLTFFPETRALVKRHITLGPSYRGSYTMVPLFYLGLYSPSVVQQLPWSRFMTSLRRHGGLQALVPTTNIASSTDQIVQPGFLGTSGDMWRLQGPLASNVDVFKLCARRSLLRWRVPGVIGHAGLLWHPASHSIIFEALENEETKVGSGEMLQSEDCQGGMAKSLNPNWSAYHQNILPELFKYAPTYPVSGWPEVPLRSYAKLD